MRNEFYELYCEEVEKNEKLTSKLQELEATHHEKISKLQTELKKERAYSRSLEIRLNKLEMTMDEIVQKAVAQAARKTAKQYEEKIMKLENQISSLKSTLNNDANNSGIPTSKTPINKDKRIPNTRSKSGKEIGGQYGHQRHILEPFKDDEVTEHVYHTTTICPNCNSDMRIIEAEETTRDEYEIDVTVKRVRHHFIPTSCASCQAEEIPEIPSTLTAPNQYGSTIQAMILALLNQGYVSMNRTRELIIGFTCGIIMLSVGYIAKVQQRTSELLVPFEAELKRAVIASDVVLWDDTVIMIKQKRSCLRVYVGDEERVALYKAHEKKDKAGVDEDGILVALSPETKVVHDHNRINYNDDYDITNCECCRHLLGDFQKVFDNLQHDWAKQFKQLLTEANAMLGEDGVLDEHTVKSLRHQWDELIVVGWEAVEKEHKKAYYVQETKALLKRLAQYKDNYLFWTVYADVPFTNNASERSLRGSKTKMKVSGQFQNINSAIAFARIRSYIETGRRHGMNPVELLAMVARGKPATLDDMRTHFGQLDHIEA
jgi:hypothetical protein